MKNKSCNYHNNGNKTTDPEIIMKIMNMFQSYCIWASHPATHQYTI